MSKTPTAWNLVIALSLIFMRTAGAFKKAEGSGKSIHGQITRDALAGTISGANLDFIIKANQSQDAVGGDAAEDARRHGDDGDLRGAVAYMNRERRKALDYAADADVDPENRTQFLRHFGLMIHTAQDFYSRSNYLELQLEDKSNQADPYNIELVDWSRVPDGYSGETTHTRLTSGRIRPSSARTSTVARENTQTFTFEELNKDNGSSMEGRKPVGTTTYFKVARDLAVRETQRQWSLLQALIKGRYHDRAGAIIAALKAASPERGASPDSVPDLDSK